MVKLAAIKKVSLAGERKYAGQDFIEIPAIGDGNCALNAFALGIIDLIKRDQEVLRDKAKQDEFMRQLSASETLLAARSVYYSTGKAEGMFSGSAYEDVVPELERFIAFIQTKPSYADFIAYVKATDTRLGVAALHVGIAPALRSIGAEVHKQQMLERGVDDPQMLAYINKMGDEGYWVGHDILASLASQDFFAVNLHMFDKKDGISFDPVDHEEEVPTINLMKSKAHWDYLMDAAQVNGLAETLATKAAVNDLSEILDETETLVQFEGAHAEKFAESPNNIESNLGEVVQVVRQAGENLLVMGEEDAAPKEYDRLAEDHGQHSSAILKSVRDNVDLSDDNLSSLKLSDLEKDLLRGSVESAEAITEDMRLAQALQDAEILHFFSAKHATFFGSQDAKRVAEKTSELDQNPTDKPNFN